MAAVVEVVSLEGAQWLDEEVLVVVEVVVWLWEGFWVELEQLWYT